MLLLAALLLAPVAASAQNSLSEARDLLNKGEAGAAYRLLNTEAVQRAGDPDFDRMLGIAALYSGQPMRAAMALERVLAVRPGDHEAREYLAQAYTRLGETEAARAAVADLRQSSATPEARARFDRLAGDIESAEAGARTSISGFLEIHGGHDSNVNSATGSSTVAIPALGGAIATLNAAGVRQSDKFIGLSGAVGIHHRLAPSWFVTGRVGATLRDNREQSQFDTANLDGSAFVGYVHGIDQFSAGFQQSTFTFDDRRLRDYQGIAAQWRRSWSRDIETLAFLQHGRLTYPRQDIRNADRTVVGASLIRTLPAGQNTVVFGTAYAGREDERANNAPFLGHDLVGLRVGGETTVHPRTTLFGTASVESRDYGGNEPLFNRGRDDRQYDLQLGLRYQIDRSLSVVPQIVYQYNDSNVAIYHYRRSIAQVGLRYQF
jgi:hypothetical protein